MDYDKYLFKNQKLQQQKQLQQQESNQRATISKRDKSFYNHRIIDLCKRIMIEQYELGLQPPEHLIQTFNGFMMESVKYFKMKDKSDILQSEFLLMGDDDTETNSIDTSGCSALNMETIIANDIENIPKKNQAGATAAATDHIRHVKTYFEKHAKVKTVFEKVANDQPQEHETQPKPQNLRTRIVFPKEKEINLNDPNLRKKGLLNINLDTVYENENYEEEEDNHEKIQKENSNTEVEVQKTAT
jgi:hypothetical protein